MSKMSELDLAIRMAANEMRYVLDDDFSDRMDIAVMDIADEFNVENTDWIREKVLDSLNS